jgi:hypothetical protein
VVCAQAATDFNAAAALLGNTPLSIPQLPTALSIGVITIITANYALKQRR